MFQSPSRCIACRQGLGEYDTYRHGGCFIERTVVNGHTCHYAFPVQRLGVGSNVLMRADEDEEEACEEAHAARAALLRVHRMLLLAPPGSQVDKVMKSLQKLLGVCPPTLAWPFSETELGSLRACFRLHSVEAHTCTQLKIPIA